MAIINRLARLFKADFNAILDQVEEPRTLLHQAIRDMEEDLQQTEIYLQQALVETDELVQRKGELEHALTENAVQLDICFEAGKEDLAREMIKRKLATERLSDRIDARMEANRKAVEGLKKTSSDNHATLESLRQKAELFTQEHRRLPAEYSTSSDVAWRNQKPQVSDSDIEVAFLQEKKRRIES
jgi:phage shock protein A